MELRGLTGLLIVTISVRVCVCAQSCPTLCDPMDCSLPGSSEHGILQARNWNGLPFPPPGDLSHPGIEPLSLVSPALAGRFFTGAPPGKPKVSKQGCKFHYSASLSSVVGRMPPPPHQDIHTITPRTCEEFILHGKSVFAAVIKVIEFKTGRLS